MKDYEAICIFKASLTEEKLNSLLSRFEKKISEGGGELVKIEKMGQKRIPFRMKKHKNEKEGFYVLIRFKGEGETASVIRDEFRVHEEVMRFLVTKIPEGEIALAEGKEDLPHDVLPDVGAKEEISGQPQ